MEGADLTSIPEKLDLDKRSALTITWRDGRMSRYPIAWLRANCPCAVCREEREERERNPRRLTVLKGDGAAPAVTGARLVGSYAVQITWSDGHDGGIYSFEYLRGEIAKMEASVATKGE
jgi:DUF971 family protein